jgi:rhodanese-related sulfurtransferase
MDQQQARAVLGNPDFVILDVRKSSDWDGSDSKIRGAVREGPSNVDAWVRKYPKDKTLLFYCN